MAKKDKQPNDRGPAGNTASKTTTMSAAAADKARSNSNSGSLGSAVRDAGPNVSRKEAERIAESTGKSVARVMAKALDKGATLGAALVNQYNKGNLGPNGNNLREVMPGYSVALGQGPGTTRALEALTPLQNLQLGKNTVYAGSSQYNVPGTQSKTADGTRTSTSGYTTYNPIVLPRGATAAGAGGNGGGNGRNGNGDGNTPNDGTIDSIKALYEQQMADARAEREQYQNQVAEQINTMQLDFGNQIADIQSAADARVSELSDLMMFQQQQSQSTQGLLQQQAMAAERAYAEQARVASALGTAYIPDIEQSAATVSLGDQRTSQSDKRQNTLSDLAIVSGLGTNSNPLAGLQLA
jgi:hypothetical protein